MSDSFAVPDLVWLDHYPQGKVYTCIFYKPLSNHCTLQEVKNSVQVRWYKESEFKKYFPDYIIDSQDYSLF